MNLYKRKIYKKSLQHAERRNHKYLYKIGDRYIYPEDVTGKAKSVGSNLLNKTSSGISNLSNKASKAINAKKDEMRLIGNAHNRPMSYGALDREKTKWDYAHATREWANDDRREADKYRNGEYFIRGNNSYDTKKQFASEKARAIGDAHASEERAKQANSDARRYMEGNIKRNAAGTVKKAAADAYVKYENKHNRKKDKKWKEEHADELAARKKREESEDERYADSIRKKWALRDQRDQGLRQEAERRERGLADLGSSSNLEKAKQSTAARKTAKKKAEAEKQRKSAHAGYEADKKAFPEGGSTEELERQKEKTAARKTKARTDTAVEEMRKRKKRMDASVEPVKPTRNISGVKPSGKAPVKETPTPKKKRRSIDRDDMRTYKKAAGMMLDEGQQNEINRRKERSERVKAGNAKMRKEINAENAKKVGKALLSGSKFGKMAMAGRSISKAASERKAERQANEKQKEAEFNRKVKADQAKSNAKMKEASKTTAKNMAKNKGMQEVAKAVSKDVAKDVYNETYKELPEGYTIKADGYIYDDIGAVVRKATADDYKKKKVSKR